MVLSRLKDFADIKMMALSQLKGITLSGVLEVIPNVYQLTSRGANVILIAEEQLSLIDTGFPGSTAQIIDFIRNLGRSVEEISLIIITHNHFDHAGGLAELRRVTRAKIAVHQADIGDSETHPPYPRAVRRLLRMRPLSALRSAFFIEPGTVDIQLSGGEVLEPLGDLTVVHTPGHTPGSISLFSPSNKLLIVSDALSKFRQNPRFPHRVASRDYALAIDSVKEIARLDFDILCFGHGRPLTYDVGSKMRNLVEKIKD